MLKNSEKSNKKTVMENKIIRDSLHGYISIPSIVFSEIIDTPIFQRLKRIEQTSMRPLYPSAHHDRFVHSLGVYYLGEKALEGLINNIDKSNYYLGKKQIWDDYGWVFKMACLLHDCAHAPFSHSFEKYYLGDKDGEKWNTIKDILKSSLSEIDGLPELSQDKKSLYEQSIDRLFLNDPPEHEIFSAIIVAQHFRKRVKKVCEGILKNFKITNEHFEFIQRAILGMKYDIDVTTNERDREKYNILNCLIQLLNSESFDVDKLDYIMRDSAASGTNNLSVDVERILSALTIIETHEYREQTTIKNDINNSVMFRDLVTRLDDDEQTKCEISLFLNNVKIDGKIKGTIKITEGKLREINSDNKYSDGSVYEFKQEKHVKGDLEHAKITGHFIGNITSTNIGDNTVNMDGFARCNIDGTICGKVIGTINWENQGTTVYEIGYKQSALSVIEDTITARNRLYMWIYAHHKVTYIDYLLRNAVLVSLLDKPQKNKLVLSDIEQDATNKIEEILSLEIFDENNISFPYFLLDDSKFITMMVHDMSNKNEFAQKYLSRTEEHSVWKNYAEYNMFFCDLSSSERKKLWLLLFDKEEKQTQYKEGMLQIFQNSILKEYDNNNINEFVWIKPSGYKISKISTDDTYILFKESVRRLKDVMIRDKVTEEYVDEHYFYLYTKTSLEYNQKSKLIDFLKQKVRESTNDSQNI